MSIRVKRWLLHYAVAALAFALIDVLWIFTVAKGQYETHIGHLLAADLNIAGAAAFYFFYVAGIVHYGIRPDDQELSLGKRVAGAALFGLFTYATWGLTALSLLKDFPAVIAITDILWGACVSGLVTLIVARLFRSPHLKYVKPQDRNG